MTPAQSFIESRGIMFEIERSGNIVSESKGLPNHEKSTSKAYIGFFPEENILVGDWLINPSGERFYVIDTITQYSFGKPNQLKAYYQTLSEYNSAKTASSTIFNIENATGSIIGTQSNFTMNYSDSIHQVKEQIENSTSPDKEELQQIINLLEMVLNNQVPAQKGLLSKFSAVLERNSWITGSIASALLSWLTTQIV